MFFSLQPCHCSVACLESVLHCYPFRPVHGVHLSSITCWMNKHHSSLPCIIHTLFMHTITGYRCIHTTGITVFSTITPFTAMSHAPPHARIESIVITLGLVQYDVYNYGREMSKNCENMSVQSTVIILCTQDFMGSVLVAICPSLSSSALQRNTVSIEAHTHTAGWSI